MLLRNTRNHVQRSPCISPFLLINTISGRYHALSHEYCLWTFCTGEALPRSAAENSSFVNASTTERNASCGLVTTNVIIQGVGIGVAGPQGERGPAGPAGPTGT